MGVDAASLPVLFRLSFVAIASVSSMLDALRGVNRPVGACVVTVYSNPAVFLGGDSLKSSHHKLRPSPSSSSYGDITAEAT